MAMTPGSTVVSWLPLFHDMGLVGNLVAPLVCGSTAILLPPNDFLGRPIRWLRAISRYRADISGGPDFAYAHCTARTSDDQLAGLDLSSWRLAFNGSEQVRPDTLTAFAERFHGVGFRARAFFPCYGLAESTLVVTSALSNRGASVRVFDSDALERGQAIPAGLVGSRQRALVSCGGHGPDVTIRIVAPDTRRELDPGEVGEIWVESASVARGYWNKRDDTGLVFGARLAGGTPGSFLRTGDLGFLYDDELFVCGRLKDIIIVRGRSYPPEDFEAAMREADPSLAHEVVAAFSIATPHGESVVLVCELSKTSRPERLQDLRDVVRGSVVSVTEVNPHDIVFVARGTIPRSSSGKVQRGRCQAMHGQQAWRVVDGRTTEQP
jgi:acyl-CoA synthetase (AMP-forming)/AMP-acid ligase II